ncbi:Molybdopterin-guanine dinucleotide biosynthesis adapter protein [bacterium HR29]|jgi:formylmethanofuran dehydrogenase subunit E|nr:Molybdopterin-guanine dinucleotide biosynthesis adapter protein [bacterium HR29]
MRERVVFDLPAVVAIRGASKSGKTSLCARLIPALERAGVRTVWVKRTHHPLDLPDKASGRIWEAAPSAMLLRAPDRRQLTLPPGTDEAADLAHSVAAYADLVLLETHRPEPVPTVLVGATPAAEGEDVLARWDGTSAASELEALVGHLRGLLPPDLTAARAIGVARAFHGGHGCPGIVLGARLALEGGRALGIALPDADKRLILVAETSRCALDAFVAVTGCRPGRRTLRIDDQGKLAARFYDLATRRAVRVAARPGLRAVASSAFPGVEPFEAQRAAYASLPAEELFLLQPWPFDLTEADLPGKPRGRVECRACGEEVTDGLHLEGETGPVCRGCAGR